MYADVLKKGNLLSHSKFTTEFSEICHIFITVFVIRPGNSRFTGTYAFARTREWRPIFDLDMRAEIPTDLDTVLSLLD